MSLRSKAPGKVVLLGEYCVLEGAPALVMAVDRLLTVTLDSATGNEWSVRSDLAGGHARFRPAPAGEVSWLNPADGAQHTLLSSLIGSLFRRFGLDLTDQPGHRIYIDSRGFYLQGPRGRQQKLGLGSSAALTVALANALCACAPVSSGISGQSWLELLVDSHREFQHGQGSGIDVAASQCGGVIRYSIAGSSPSTDRLNLPSELQFGFVWSGRPSSTPNMLGRLRRWSGQNPADYNRTMCDLTECSSAGLDAIEKGDGAGFLRAAGEFAGFLSQLENRAGLAIFGEAHEDLLAMANQVGLVYKPCGAGNGDLGVAMSMDQDAIREFLSRSTQSGYRTINISAYPDGAQVIRS